ncbi:MAG: alpha/beta hydrolase fold domain-containing protein [Micrococcales bacterium]|nr:alpha/beta hydrolase fold domain-containing protein [Micrococcales bacterium]
MPARRQRSTIAGRIDVTSMLLRDRRITVRIYVPADYEWSAREYPVLYMFDGHNLFDRTTSTYGKEWRVDETMQSLGRPAIVVGIDAPQNRYERYAMYTVSDWEYRARSSGRLLKRIRGYGDETAAFLIEQVKPYVEATYRAASDREQVGVAGSSMGGYMSLVVGTRYQDRVSRVLAFSPVALDEPMRGFELREAIVGAGAPVAQRYYLDMGDRERLDYVRNPQELVDNLEGLRSALVHAGHRDVLARIVPGGRHDERAWARRFPEAYLWAFFGVELG